MTPQKKAVEKWRKKNPQWYMGRVYVDLLNRAVKNMNPHSKIWFYAGMKGSKWIADFHDLNGFTGMVTLEPIVGWRHFDLQKRSDVRKFLLPSNFKLTTNDKDDSHG